MPRLAVLVALTGCNGVFGLDKTVLVDAPSCTPIASDFDDFEQPTTMPCSWGYLTQESCTATATGGELVMTPAAGVTNAICVCGTNTPMTFNPAFGTMVEVHDVADLAGEYTQLLAADFAGGTAWTLAYVPGSGIRFSSGMTRLGSVPWDASSRWWRIRPDDGGTAVVGEVSPDGKVWSAIAMDPVTPPAMIKLSFSTGTFQSLTAPSAARLASINICPP